MQAQDDNQAADPAGSGEGSQDAQSGFGSRGRARRRARFLRKARELAYRDLGGLVYNLHRFGQRNDALVLAKLTTLGHIDSELRGIEAALQEREPVTVLREAGITACPRCAAIHGSEDRFCPNCGLSMSRHVDLPVAGAASAAAQQPSPVAQPQPAPSTAAPLAPTPPAPVPAAAPAPTAAPPPSATHAPVPAEQPSAADPSPPASAAPTPSPEPSPSPEPPSASEADDEASEHVSTGGEEATEIIRPGASGS